MTQPALIVGAGLAGLIAAHAWPRTLVVEASPQPRQMHQALLRFRSDAVARLTGIEFRRVQVRKSIWHDGAHRKPDIALANMYSQKVAGGALLGDRSIWNIDPAERWVAPPTFYEQMVDSVGARIQWGGQVQWQRDSGHAPIVSTAPLSMTAKELALVDQQALFPRAQITVVRGKLHRADIFQTVYFPEVTSRLYRASVTGDTLICEFMTDIAHSAPAPIEVREWWPDVSAALGLHPTQTPQELTQAEQRYGKIAPVDDLERRRILYELTQKHKIYSLGRFATWRNILLDDVVHDIDVIKRLIAHADAYALRHRA